MNRRLTCTLGLISIGLFHSAGLAAPPAAGLKAGDLVAVCGDSITEQKLYSVYIEDYLLICRPAAGVRTVQAGWSGEVAAGFLTRMDRDVLAFHPTVATTCYGMNDGGYAALAPDRATWYRDNQLAIVKAFKKAGLRLVVLGSPGCVDADTFCNSPERAKVYNTTLGKLRDIDRQIAKDQGVIFADVHGSMMAAMAKAKAKYGKAYHLAGADGVHPGRNGQLVMAYAFLKAMGCDGNLGTITLDLATGKAQATDGHTVLASSRDNVTIESHRYPFCFFGDPKSPDATRGVIEFFPFNDDLNRLQLVVNAANPQTCYKITWGKCSRQFIGEALAKGINLAAEFLDNPFCGPFQKVEQAVQTQQNWETPLTKILLHDLPAYREAMPDEAATLDRIQSKLISRDKALANDAAKAVTPVQHTIRVAIVEP